jgi:hypothetical protein
MPFSHGSLGLSTLAAWDLPRQDYLATSGNGLMFQLTL